MYDYEIYLKEIITMSERIENSLKGISFEDFIKDSNVFDATLMRIHFIGETINHIPYSLKKKYKNIRWRKFARLRNIIGHKYSNVNKEIIWDVIKSISELKEQVKEIIKKPSIYSDGMK